MLYHLVIYCLFRFLERSPRIILVNRRWRYRQENFCWRIRHDLNSGNVTVPRQWTTSSGSKKKPYIMIFQWQRNLPSVKIAYTYLAFQFLDPTAIQWVIKLAVWGTPRAVGPEKYVCTTISSLCSVSDYSFMKYYRFVKHCAFSIIIFCLVPHPQHYPAVYCSPSGSEVLAKGHEMTKVRE